MRPALAIAVCLLIFSGSAWAGCDCYGSACACCELVSVHELHFKEEVCANVTAFPSVLDVDLSISVGKYVVYDKNVSLLSPDICLSIPGLTKEARACLHFYNTSVSTKAVSSCLEFEIYLLKHCVYHTLLGCFHFDLMNRAVDSNAHGAANSVAVSAPFRLPGSPYPAPGQGPNSTRTVVVFNDTLLTSTQLLTVQTLQGIVARQAPALFRVSGGGLADMQSTWLQDLAVPLDTTLAGNFTGLLARFAPLIKGYVLCDAASLLNSSHRARRHLNFRAQAAFQQPQLQSESVNVALSLAAAHDGLIVVSLQEQASMASLGIPLTLDARKLTSMQVLNSYPFNRRVAVLQDPSKFDFLSDFSVFARAFSWFDITPGIIGPVSTALLDTLQTPAAVLGWGPTEGSTVDTLSSHGSYIHAADFAPNLATLSSFYVPELRQRTGPSPPGTPVSSRPKHTVCFLMTDGDNIQWLLDTFAIPGNSWYGSVSRGKVPLGWTVSPAMSELAPTVLSHFFQEAVPGMDYFVAGPSGVGYSIPEKFPTSASLAAFTNLTAAFMAKADLSIVNLIDDQDCDVACAAPFLAHDNVLGVFLYEGNQYVGRHGRLTWANNKPIVGGRVAMWGTNTPEVVAQALRFQPQDPHNPDSYSLVPVHVWTHNVTDVYRAAQMLDPASFDVVHPLEFVARIQANVFHACQEASKAIGPFLQSCKGGEDTCSVLRNVVCQSSGGSTLTTPFFDHSMCPGHQVDNCFGRLICIGSPCSCPPKAVGSFTESCSGCQDVCGTLSGCRCKGEALAEQATQPFFDYSSCPGSLVADCNGALICQGERCF